MSTVIWYEGILYSDSQVTSEEITDEKGITLSKTISKGKKLFRVGNKIYGVTGTLNGYSDFISRGYSGFWRWSRESSLFALILEWDGKKLISWRLMEKKIWGFYFSWFKKIEHNWRNNSKLVLYMGSGNGFAIEANKKGLTITEMIQYASDRDPYTDDEVVSMSL